MSEPPRSPSFDYPNGLGPLPEGLRICRRCKLFLPCTSFSKSSRIVDGLQTICKTCDVVAVQESRKRKLDGASFPQGHARTSEAELLNILNAQFAKLKFAKLKRSNGFIQMKQEVLSTNALEKRLEGIEMRRWQDATKSDVGVRPVLSGVDSWLPLQLKSSSRERWHRFRLIGRDGMLPSCDTVCIIMEPFAILYVRQEDIPLLVLDNDGGWSVSNSTMSQWEMNATELSATLLQRWADHSATFSEMTLRLQVNAKYMVEMMSIVHSNSLLPDSITEWPSETMGVTDLIRDGKKEQYKSVQRCGNLFSVRHCWKKMCGVQVAYEIGDNDWYVFGYSTDKYYLQWRIPESFMVSRGMLSHKNESASLFVYPGRVNIMLAIVGPHGENASLQMHIVGRPQGSDANTETAQFLHVLWL